MLGVRPELAHTTGSGSTTQSPQDALERDEILRTRLFCVIGAVIAISGATAVPLLPGDAAAGAAVLSCAGFAIAAIVFLYVRTLDPVRFRKRSTLLGWYVPAMCVTSAIPYFGAFSPAAVVLVLGTYFVGLGRSAPLAAAVYVTL